MTYEHGKKYVYDATSQTFDPVVEPGDKTAFDLAFADLAGRQVDHMIAQEIKLQDAMWGKMNERGDISKGQLFHAGHTQVAAILARRFGSADAFEIGGPVHSAFYPRDWDGFRSYGGDIPNIVVAVAYLRQEAKNLLSQGQDPTRLSRTEAQAEAYRRQSPGPAFTTADPDWREKAGIGAPPVVKVD